MKPTAEPAWMKPCREELLRIDPRYLVVFNIRWRQFDGHCTSEQIRAVMLADKQYDWTPTDRTIRTWLARIAPIETKHKQRAEAL